MACSTLHTPASPPKYTPVSQGPVSTSEQRIEVWYPHLKPAVKQQLGLYGVGSQVFYLAIFLFLGLCFVHSIAARSWPFAAITALIEIAVYVRMSMDEWFEYQRQGRKRSAATLCIKLVVAYLVGGMFSGVAAASAAETQRHDFEVSQFLGFWGSVLVVWDVVHVLVAMIQLNKCKRSFAESSFGMFFSNQGVP